MKNKASKKTITFGEFIKRVCDAYGKREGRKIVWRAVNTRVIVFCDHPRVVVVP